MKDSQRIMPEGEDYCLAPDAQSAWVRVDELVLWIRRQPEGVSVEFYVSGDEGKDALQIVDVQNPGVE